MADSQSPLCIHTFSKNMFSPDLYHFMPFFQSYTSTFFFSPISYKCIAFPVLHLFSFPFIQSINSISVCYFCLEKLRELKHCIVRLQLKLKCYMFILKVLTMKIFLLWLCASSVSVCLFLVTCLLLTFSLLPLPTSPPRENKK